MNKADGRRYDFSPRRLALAAAVVALHVFFVVGLLSVRETLRGPPAREEPRALTWITLRPQVPEPAPQPAPKLYQPPKAPKRAAILPPVELPASPNAITEEPAQAVLRSYVGCGLNDSKGLWEEERKNCETLRASLHPGPLASLPPTEREIQLGRQFKRDKIRRDSPIQIPCVMFVMVNPICVVMGMINGFEMGTHADYEPKPDPHHVPYFIRVAEPVGSHPHH